MKSIRSILLAGLAVIALLFLAQALLLSWGQKRIDENVVATMQRNTVAASKLAEVAVLAQQVRRYEKEYFVYVSNVERRNAYVKEWSATQSKLAQQLQAIRSNEGGAFSADDVGRVANWASANDFYGAEMRKIFVLVDDRQNQLAGVTAPATPTPTPVTKTANTTVTPSAPSVGMFSPIEVNAMIGAGKDRLSNVLVKGVSDLSAEKTKATLALPEVAKSEFGTLWNGVMASVVIGLLIAGLLAIRLPRAITGPVADLSGAVDRVSRGELDQPLNVRVPDEFATLTTAVERMRVAQRALLTRLRSRAST